MSRFSWGAQLQPPGRREADREVFQTLLPDFIVRFSLPFGSTRHFRSAKSKFAPSRISLLGIPPTVSLWARSCPVFPWKPDLFRRHTPPPPTPSPVCW